MIALKITDTRDFMKRLLASEQFDTFLFSEGTVTTFTTFTVDGTWHPDYYEDQDPDAESSSSVESLVPKALTWKLLRPVFFDIIKGKHTPVSFRIILRLAEYNVENMLSSSALSIDASQVAGLFLNLSYHGNAVTCTTGTSLRCFTMDKTLDNTWDDMVLRFFRSRQISFETM